MKYVFFLILAIGLIGLYYCILQWNKPYFELVKNQERKLFESKEEIIVLSFGEIAMFKIWLEFYGGELSGIMLALLYTNLVCMMVLCITDYWECIVPNRIILLCVSCCLIEIGLQYVHASGIIVEIFPSMILGFLFSLFSFGGAYLISRGQIGEGDVKLALVLGIFITGNYVVRTVFYGCCISAFFSIVQLLRNKITRKDEIPFVPFLYMGMIITYIVG